MHQRQATNRLKTEPLEAVLPASLKPVEQLPLDPCYAGLSDPYHTPVAPTPLPQPRLVHFNEPLAAELGIDAGDQALVDILSGNRRWIFRSNGITCRLTTNEWIYEIC